MGIQSVQLNPGWNAVCFWLEPEGRPGHDFYQYRYLACLAVGPPVHERAIHLDMNNRLAESPHWQYWYPECVGAGVSHTIDETDLAARPI
jgi:hypothetical protein